MAIATALTIGSLLASGASAGMSFAQVGKQKQLQKEAEKAAEKALSEAKQILDVNYLESLGINKEPYNLQREALLASGAEAIAAGVESERGAAGVAGAIQMAQNKAQQNIASAMGTDITALNKLVAQEDSRLAGEQAKLYLGEAEGAQLAARDAQQAGVAATNAGVNSLLNMASNAASLAPLYPKTKAPDVITPNTATGTSNPNVTVPFAPAPFGSVMQLAPKTNGPQSPSTLTPFNYGFNSPSVGGLNNPEMQQFLEWENSSKPFGTNNQSVPFNVKWQQFLQWKNAINR